MSPMSPKATDLNIAIGRPCTHRAPAFESYGSAEAHRKVPANTHVMLMISGNFAILTGHGSNDNTECSDCILVITNWERHIGEANVRYFSIKRKYMDARRDPTLPGNISIVRTDSFTIA